MSAWLPWLAAAAVLIVLPVVLRLFAGEDEPDNAITQEQPGAGERDPEVRSAGGDEFRLVA